MKVAYVFLSTTCQKLLTNMIIPQLQLGKHGAEVAGMFFVVDNTFFLVKGTETAQNLRSWFDTSPRTDIQQVTNAKVRSP